MGLTHRPRLAARADEAYESAITPPLAASDPLPAPCCPWSTAHTPDTAHDQLHSYLKTIAVLRPLHHPRHSKERQPVHTAAHAGSRLQFIEQGVPPQRRDFIPSRQPLEESEESLALLEAGEQLCLKVSEHRLLRLR